jgi:hypothetical protein
VKHNVASSFAGILEVYECRKDLLELGNLELVFARKIAGGNAFFQISISLQYSHALLACLLFAGLVD